MFSEIVQLIIIALTGVCFFLSPAKQAIFPVLKKEYLSCPFRKPVRKEEGKEDSEEEPQEKYETGNTYDCFFHTVSKDRRS